ncbi:hypothetical protein ACJMK2_014031 [Sinanodonta woodiana]|uniref:Uncharacterized protein n=1 Tax=Sinanodonta woodiana TaxID=1069815 RepID=A0ABD3V2M7_SINWO
MHAILYTCSMATMSCFNTAKIEEDTRGQRKNIVWKKHKRALLQSQNLVCFAGYSKDAYSNSLRWRKKNENKALICYLQFYNQNEHKICK